MGANLMFSNIGGALMITVIGYIIGATNATVGLYCLVGVQLCTCLGEFILHMLYKLFEGEREVRSVWNLSYIKEGNF